MTLTLRTDRSLVRAGAASTRYLAITLVAPQALPRAGRTPVHIALVLDRSGSMAGDRKFPLARRAVEQSLAMLHPDDRFSLVVYDQEIDVLVSSVPATAEAKRTALAVLAAIEPRGSTDLCGGWMRGCEQIAMHLRRDQVSRCLLLTDGLANQGVTDHAQIVRHAGELRARGIATSTFGVGADFDERLLRDMAQAGGGHAYYIQSPEQVIDLLTSELGEAIETVMRDAALEVALPAEANVECLNAFPQRWISDRNELRIELNDLVSAQEITAVVRITFPPREPGERLVAGVSVSHRADGARVPHARAEIAWTYASHRETDVQPRDREVDVQVATQYAARARLEATERNRAGDYEGARRVLDATARKIRSYAGGDARLLRIAGELEQQREEFAAPMAAPVLKQAFFAAEAAARSRTGSGKAERRS